MIQPRGKITGPGLEISRRSLRCTSLTESWLWVCSIFILSFGILNFTIYYLLVFKRKKNISRKTLIFPQAKNSTLVRRLPQGNCSWRMQFCHLILDSSESKYVYFGKPQTLLKCGIYRLLLGSFLWTSTSFLLLMSQHSTTSRMITKVLRPP